MSNHLKFYIDGAWVDPIAPNPIDVIDPSTEEAFTHISGGTAADIDRAVRAARAAFDSFSRTTPAERLELLEAILVEYDRRYEDIAQACTQEMGAPLAFARNAQAWIGQAHLREMIRVMKSYRFSWMEGDMQIVREPIGVVGMITPWNWPLNQITCKVGPAIASGCTMVLKPSEIAPVTGIIFSEVMHAAGVANMFSNSGQSCNAPSRMLVPRERHAEVVELARQAAGNFTVGDPRSENSNLGPVVSKVQFDKIQNLIQSGIEEGAELVAGGPGLPDGLSRGYYVRPTVFANVKPEMRIAKEEIFGPVLSIMPYETEEEAIAEANNTVYGLAAYIQSEDLEKARRVASRMRAGTIYINAPSTKISAPFGGFKQSGNGREWSHWGLDDFTEIKGIVGYGAV
jgi:acyl-CoA reductase-like NAD-dependent aldehyde dehydrogenase